MLLFAKTDFCSCCCQALLALVWLLDWHCASICYGCYSLYALNVPFCSCCTLQCNDTRCCGWCSNRTKYISLCTNDPFCCTLQSIAPVVRSILHVCGQLVIQIVLQYVLKSALLSLLQSVNGSGLHLVTYVHLQRALRPVNLLVYIQVYEQLYTRFY